MPDPHAPPMLAVRPPEYLPRLAFFALAARAGSFVVGDTFQYSRQSYQNRARLCTPEGTMWLTVPLAGGQHGRAIDRTEIDDRVDWRRKHLKALRFNYGMAPFFAEYAPRVEALLLQPWPTLGALTLASAHLLAGLLGLGDRFALASGLPGRPGSLSGVRDALPPADLVALPDTAAHDGAQTLAWQETTRYQPFGGTFRPDCSALDALMMYGPQARHFL